MESREATARGFRFSAAVMCILMADAGVEKTVYRASVGRYRSGYLWVLVKTAAYLFSSGLKATVFLPRILWVKSG